MHHMAEDLRNPQAQILSMLVTDPEQRNLANIIINSQRDKTNLSALPTTTPAQPLAIHPVPPIQISGYPGNIATINNGQIAGPVEVNSQNHGYHQAPPQLYPVSAPLGLGPAPQLAPQARDAASLVNNHDSSYGTVPAPVLPPAPPLRTADSFPSNLPPGNTTGPSALGGHILDPVPALTHDDSGIYLEPMRADLDSATLEPEPQSSTSPNMMLNENYQAKHSSVGQSSSRQYEHLMTAYRMRLLNQPGK